MTTKMISKRHVTVRWGNDRNRRGTALMEFALFSAVCLAALGFLLRVAGQAFGTIVTTSETFRLCEHHAAEDNEANDVLGPYEVRSVNGLLQMLRPSVSMNSWSVGVSEVVRGCYAEWGTRLTMSHTPGCGDAGPGEPYVFAYAGDDSQMAEPLSQVGCQPPGTAFNTASKLSILAEDSVVQTTQGGTTTATATVYAGGSSKLSLMTGDDLNQNAGPGTVTVTGGTSDFETPKSEFGL